MRWVWDWGFLLGSTVVAFVQGAAVGAMIRGIPVANGQYAGSPFGWLHPFAILTGIGLVLGYALLGAGWLVLKSDGELRDWAYAASGGSAPACWSCWCWLSRSRSTTASSREAICRQALGTRVPRDRRARAGGDSSGHGRSATAGRSR